MTLGALILQLRMKHGYSQAAFAREVGCSPTFVCLVEKGQKFPSHAVLCKMARVLRTTPEKLLEHDTSRRPAPVDPRMATPDSYLTLGQKVRRRRVAKGLSMHDLARRADCTASFICFIEKDHTRPSPATLSRLAKALDTTVVDLQDTDVRPLFKILQRRAIADPALVVALRALLEASIPGSELEAFVAKKEIQ